MSMANGNKVHEVSLQSSFETVREWMNDNIDPASTGYMMTDPYVIESIATILSIFTPYDVAIKDIVYTAAEYKRLFVEHYKDFINE